MGVLASAGEQSGILRGPETSASGALSPHDLSGGSAAEPPVGNNYWRSVGDGLFCPLAVATVSGRFSLFARTSAGECVCRRWDSGGWASLTSLGVPRARREGSPASIAVDWQLSGCRGEGGTVLLFGRSPD